MASYLDILRPNVLTQVVRQVVASADPILVFMGFQPGFGEPGTDGYSAGGINQKYFGHGREGAFHIYNDSRKTAKGRAPGTAAGRSSKQNMIQVPFTYPRMHDSIDLLAEFVHNLGRIDDPTIRDEAGRGMIERQTRTLAQKAVNWRIAMTVGMLRDQLYMHQDGDDWFPNYSSGSALFQINHRVPAGNKSQLNMTDRDGTSVHGGNIIDVPWSSSGANIPEHIAKINQARSVQGVGPVTDVHLNSILWQNIIQNDYIGAYAGISNPPFQTFSRKVGDRPDGSPLHEYVAQINSLPGITWHISDEGLELWDAANGEYAFTKHWDDTMAIFMGNPIARADNFTLYQGSEPIAEYDGGPETVRVGLSSWSKKVASPTKTEIYVLDNALPVNHDPYSVQIGTVVFG